MPDKKPITDEIAGIEKDIFQDYIGKTLLNPDKVLKSESGGKGIELYEDLLRDTQVGSTLQTRRLAVVGKEWEIVPATEKRQDVKIAEFVKEVLLGFNYDAARRALLSGIVLGFKPAEIMWEYSEGDIWIKDIIGRASRRFVFDLKNNLRLLTPANMIEGEELPEKKFVVYKNISDNGSPYGDGLGRMLYWPAWFKKNAIKFWMIFADKFGSPTAIGKYPAGTTKEQQDALLAALEAIQQESAIKIPDNMIIELLEAARTGTVDTYEKLCSFMDSAISKVMLGQTLTTEVGDKGSYAASQTHNDVREDYIKADADGLCEAQNSSLIRWIIDYNFPDAGKYPKIWIRTAQEKDLKPLAERDQILVQNIGLPVSKKYFYETYGIPQPEEGEELIKIQGQGSWVKGQQEQGKEFTEGIKFTPEQKALEGLKENIAADWEKVVGPTIEPILKIIEGAATIEEAKARLMDAYGIMDNTQASELIARAIFSADAWGRLNA